MAAFTRFLPLFGALERGRRRLRRSARAVTGRLRMVVVPLLDPKQTRHALDLACKLAAERGARVLLIAPLFVDAELPLDAQFDGEEAALRAELDRERALVESYGISAESRIVRARHGQLGRGLADVADDVHASLIVIGVPVDSRRGFRRPFSRNVWSVLHDAPCPVMIATGRPRVRARAAA